MASSDVAVHSDDDGGGGGGYANKCLEISEFSVAATNRELVNLENAAVNIDNSTDVIIGPVTQFNVNGNVTIYQNKDGLPVGVRPQLEEEPAEAACPADLKEQADKKYLKTLVTHRLKDLYAKRKNNLGWLCVSTLLSACGLVLFLSVKPHELASPVRTVHDQSLGNYTIYNEWGGRRVNPSQRNPLPVGLVVVDHTESKTCAAFDECSSIMRALQRYEMSVVGWTNICENFYVSGDGDVYVGRGWEAKNCLADKINVGISFIGDFNKDSLNDDMKESFRLLLRRGVNLSVLAEDYLLVGRNQTVFSESPGKNVYSFIKTLPNFSDVDLRQRIVSAGNGVSPSSSSLRSIKSPKELVHSSIARTLNPFLSLKDALKPMMFGWSSFRRTSASESSLSLISLEKSWPLRLLIIFFTAQGERDLPGDRSNS